MARPFTAGLTLLLLAAACQADAQSLGDAARKAEERRKQSTSSLVFDGRDLDPALAEQELRDFALTTARWQRYLAAARPIGAAFQGDPAIVARLRSVQATSVLALERFLKREPALAAALATGGADAHEFAFTQLAIGMVLSAQALDRGRGLEGESQQVRANASFLTERQAELQALSIPRELMVLRISKAAASRAVAQGPEPEAAAPPATGAPASAPAVAVGAPVADFTFVDFNGTTRRLSDYRGRYVLLDFWGVWCPNCRAEVPYLKDAYDRFQSRGLEIIGMDYEKTATVEEVRKYLVANGVNWTFARPDSVRDVIKGQFQIEGFPTQLLVHPNGGLLEIPSATLRGANLARTLDRLLPK